MPKTPPAATLCPPAWRMALVICYDIVNPCDETDPDPFYEWHPIVAVHSRQEAPLRHNDDWWEHIDMLIMEKNEGRARSLSEYREEANHYPQEVVVCTWPPAEDEERFLAVARQLATQLEKKVQVHPSGVQP